MARAPMGSADPGMGFGRHQLHGPTIASVFPKPMPGSAGWARCGVRTLLMLHRKRAASPRGRGGASKVRACVCGQHSPDALTETPARWASQELP